MPKTRMAVLRGLATTGDEATCLQDNVPPTLAEYLFINSREQVLAKQTKNATGRTPSQCLILAALLQHEGPKQNDLIELTGIDRSTLSNCIARMAKAGLVLRSVNGDDNRRWRVSLSRSGKTAARRVVRKLGVIK